MGGAIDTGSHLARPHAGPRHGGAVQDFLDDRPGIDVLDAGRRADDQPVGQGNHGQRFDVVGRDVIPAQDGRPGLARLVEGDAAPGAGAQVDVGMLARARHQADDILLDQIV